MEGGHLMEVAGYKAVRKSLSEMRGCEQVVGRALVAGAMKVRNEARNLAPVKTGNLKRSIDVGNLQSSGDTMTVEVGTDVVYAARIEYGFKGVDSLGRRYKQDGRPYLEPALKAKEKEVADDIEKAIAQQGGM